MSPSAFNSSLSAFCSAFLTCNPLGQPTSKNFSVPHLAKRVGVPRQLVVQFFGWSSVKHVAKYPQRAAKTAHCHPCLVDHWRTSPQADVVASEHITLRCAAHGAPTAPGSPCLSWKSSRRPDTSSRLTTRRGF